MTISKEDGDSIELSRLADSRGKVAFVTGAGNGIGRATALRLAEAGARIACFDFRPNFNEETIQLLGSKADHIAIEGDVRERSDIERGVAEAVDRLGRIDIVVNSAGIFPAVPLLEIDDALWQRVIGTNATGTFLTSQICANQMRKQGDGGTIVNVASKSSFQPTKGFAHYAASKGAVKMITKALALELSPYGIRVNAVAPGGVATSGFANSGGYMGSDPGTETQARSSRTPMSRNATPDEIARE